MDYYGERSDYYFCEEEDPYSTPRAGSFYYGVDAVLPWRFEDPLSPPPPVPPKNDSPLIKLKARSAAASAASILPERVTSPSPSPSPSPSTPWLFRRVKTPVTHATQTATATASQKADNNINIRGFPKKPEPPAYHAVPQQPQPQPQPRQQVHPSEERLAITTTTSRGPAAATVIQSQSQAQSTAVRVQQSHSTPPPPKPAAVAYHRSTSTRGGQTQTQRVPNPPTSSHPSCPQLRSVRSAPQEERSRRPGTRGSARAPEPLRPAAVQPPVERRVHLPSYHSTEPFPSPGSPAPPPYRVSAEDSYPISVRSRSLPRSGRSKHGGPTYEKEAIPPLPPLPSHNRPRLSSSAKSRIEAGYKVSKEFGDAIMKQELRFATPTSDHSSGRLDGPVPNPRLGQRFLSASELQSHRRAKLRTDKITPEHEARQRPSNKSSSSVGRYLGDSRLRTTSAHSGRGQEKGSQRGRR